MFDLQEIVHNMALGMDVKRGMEMYKYYDSPSVTRSKLQAKRYWQAHNRVRRAIGLEEIKL